MTVKGIFQGYIRSRLYPEPLCALVHRVFMYMRIHSQPSVAVASFSFNFVYAFCSVCFHGNEYCAGFKPKFAFLKMNKNKLFILKTFFPLQWPIKAVIRFFILCKNASEIGVCCRSSSFHWLLLPHKASLFTAKPFQIVYRLSLASSHTQRCTNF